MWEIVMIFKMSYSVFVLFTGIEPTQAPSFIPHLLGGGLLAGKDELFPKRLNLGCTYDLKSS